MLLRNKPLSLTALDSFFSENGHPFVCSADISPNRGISLQGRLLTSNIKLPDKLQFIALFSNYCYCFSSVVDINIQKYYNMFEQNFDTSIVNGRLFA